MLVWIFQTGEPLQIDAGNPRKMRAINLSNKLVEAGHQVVLWSSAFSHQDKYHRTKKYEEHQVNENLEIYLVPSPGYSRNISISRLFDHFILALNMRKLLSLQKKIPDVAFIGYPPIECAFVFTHWLKKKNVPSVLDIKDQWPEIFLQSVPKFIRIFAGILLFPYYLIAKKTMQNTTGVCAMSKSFVNWSLGFSGQTKSKHDFIAPLTSPREQLTDIEKNLAISWWSERGVKEDGIFRIIFVGSFSRAFDFDKIFKAASDLVESNINCEFILCGDGELSEDLHDKASQYKNITITGWIDQAKILTLSNMSSAFIAPYRNSPDFVMSIPNKVVDAFKLGMPLLSSLKGEVENIIKYNKVGFLYSDAISLSDCIKSLIDDDKLQEKMSTNAKNLYDEKFEFNKVYGGLVDHLEGMVKKND